jgi:protein-disulfide isomerase
VAQTQRKKATSKGSRPSKASNLRVFYLILALIAVGGVGWIAYSMVGGGSATALQAVDLTGLDDPQALFNAAKGITLGEPDAAVQILVFSDFTCPSCKTWTQRVEPQLKKEFIETGRVKLVYHDFPLGPAPGHVHGFLAARAGRCAQDQNRFWEFHDVLFARQSEWTFAGSPPVAQFTEYAGAVGVDTNAFESCLESDMHAEVVTANRKLGEQLGVGGTPTVYVGSRPVIQWSSWDAVREAVQRELGG